MNDSIKGDVLTKERTARKDIRMIDGGQNGIGFYAPSYLDILFDNDVITESHKAAGMTYWSLREYSFPFLATKANPLFADVVGENNEAESPITEHDEGDPIDLFLRIRLKMDDKQIIESCCQQAAGNALAIVWAYGVNRILWAFDALEKAIPEAREELRIMLNHV